MILFHKHYVSPTTVGLFPCCCTGFIKYLISSNSFAELCVSKVEKKKKDYKLRHTLDYIQLRFKANLGSDSIFTYHHVFCTAGLIIWQFMQSSCTLPFKHLMPMMWLLLKIIPVFFFSPSFPLCSSETATWICQKNGEIEYKSCLQGKVPVQTSVSLNANCNQKGQDSPSL